MVSISNLTMSEIYVLTEMISERMMMHLEILMLLKAERPDAFAEKFPGLRGRLSNSDICGFTGTKLSTLGYSRTGR